MKYILFGLSFYLGILMSNIAKTAYGQTPLIQVYRGSEKSTKEIRPPIQQETLSPQPRFREITRPTISEVQPVAGASGQLVAQIREVFGEEAGTALEIARRESNFNCGAVGDSGGSLGLFQIHAPAWPQFDRQKLLECEYNIQAAKIILDKTSWRSWSTYGRIN